MERLVLLGSVLQENEVSNMKGTMVEIEDNCFIRHAQKLFVFCVFI